MPESVLELTEVHAGYLSGVSIVNGVTHRFPAGTVTTIVGPNGAGKSTLLRAVYGLTKWCSGSIRVGGVDIAGIPPHRRLAAGVGIVPQGRCNFPHLTVIDNLRLAVYSLPRRAQPNAVDRVLEQFPALADQRRRHAGLLSGGQQQMLETAMALAVEPRVLLIDEPSLGLSPRARAEVFDNLRSIAIDGVTVVMVEQNVVEGLEASDHAVVMVEGRIERQDAADTILTDPEMKAVFLGGRPGDEHEGSLPAPEPMTLQEKA